ncbi:hypothetical protein RchiOBHm_Chr1g0320761 [Rosa chinensis]|uniref:Uncharacterized protein n=1 Tax=Rosa chinensis TaxID=74649 RepID=A0A2P6S8S8_ROSCH|nr:hypothetical protein RchiOBHm_Chr1g0320761 [Rosa chinensis]
MVFCVSMKFLTSAAASQVQVGKEQRASFSSHRLLSFVKKEVTEFVPCSHSCMAFSIWNNKTVLVWENLSCNSNHIPLASLQWMTLLEMSFDIAPSNQVLTRTLHRSHCSCSLGFYQLWENYSHVALDVGNVAQASAFLQRTSEVGKSREAEHLVEFLGKVIQQIKLKGDLSMCREAWLKQVRSYQGSDLWNDRDQFKKFVKSSLELCKVYMEISSSTGSRDELLSAERHLWNIMKQARLGISES